MLLIHGIYRFCRRRIGCRRDYCNACEQEHLAEQWQSFNVLHLYWVPVLPLGLWDRWECAQCHRDPRGRYHTASWVMYLALALCGLLLLCSFLANVQGLNAKDQLSLWAGRGIVLGIFLIILWSMRRRRPGLSPEERRRQVVPLPADHCVYCEGPLKTGPRPYCPRCRIRVYRE